MSSIRATGGLGQTGVASRRRKPFNHYVWYALPGVIAFTAVIGGGFAATVYTSFTQWNGVGTMTWVGWQNYATLMTDTVFWQSFLHAIIFIISMSLIPTGLGLLVGALLFDFIAPKFGAGIAAGMRASIFVPQIIPITVSGILWVWLLSPNLGVVNQTLRAIGLGALAKDWLANPSLAIWALSVMLVWIQLGYTIVIFMSGLARLDTSLNEAAQLDGANWVARFRHVTLHQLRPEIAVVLLTTTVAALKVFAPIYVMTQGGPGNATTVPSFFSYYQFFTTTKVGYGSAVATVLAIILTIVAIVILNLQSRQEAKR